MNRLELIIVLLIVSQTVVNGIALRLIHALERRLNRLEATGVARRKADP